MSWQEPPGGPPGSPYGQPPAPGGPPAPYAPPGGAFLPGMGPLEVRNPGAIKVRNSVAVVLLSLFTCGIYYFFWLYWTGCELKEALGDEEITPGLDVLLTIVTCFVWSIYVEYRNAQKIYRARLSRDLQAKNQTDMVLMMDVVGLFVGMTWLVGTFILQEELNKLAQF